MKQNVLSLLQSANLQSPLVIAMQLQRQPVRQDLVTNTLEFAVDADVADPISGGPDCVLSDDSALPTVSASQAA